MIRRHKGAVILATFLGALGGFLMTLSDARIYQARTSLEIQGLNEEFLNMKSVNPVSDAGSRYPHSQTSGAMMPMARMIFISPR